MKKVSLIICLFFLSAVAIAADGLEKFQLTSPSFNDGDALPSKYTCLELDVSPSFEFKNIPPKTKSLAIAVYSPDAPEGRWVHWVVYNIPFNKDVIEENVVPGTQLFNDFGKFIYAGPCPVNEKLYHYEFKAYALNAKLDIIEGGILKDLERSIRGHVLAESSLTVSFQKTSL